MYLYKLFAAHTSEEDKKKIYKSRFDGFTSVKTGLKIKPMSQSESFELFYNISRETFLKTDEIRINQIKLSSVYDYLPELAKEKLIIDLISDELKSSNDLEGVESSKEEIVHTTKQIYSKKASKDRLSSMINSYIELLRGDLKLPEDCWDIRKIYDFITEGEIEKNELPDGEIFRANQAQVNSRGPVGKAPIHLGVMPESEICRLITDQVNFINSKPKISIIDIAVAHYYFGYIHPFYDGNGRTSRFISSLYIDRVYDKLTAISLSQGCNKLRRDYLDAFKRTNQVNNMGEMDYFIDTFIKIIIEGQEVLLDNLQEKKTLLDLAGKRIYKDPDLKDDDLKKSLLFFLAQAYHFSLDRGISWGELSELTKYSKKVTRKPLDELEQAGKIRRLKDRPLVFMLSQAYLEEI